MPYKNGDFVKYYCNKLKQHVWVLGYFGGGHVNFAKFKEVAEDFSRETKIPVEDIWVGEIYSSRRFKGFKYIYAIQYNDKKVKQTPLEDSKVIDDVFDWLHA